MGRLRRSRVHKNIKDIKKKFRTRKRTKDVDQIHEDLEPERADKFLHQKIDPDLPGSGQFYCLQCAKYFVDQKAILDHTKSKVHKRRLKQLKEKPYTQAEAEMAAGMGSYSVKSKSTSQTVEKQDDTTNADDETMESEDLNAAN